MRRFAALAAIILLTGTVSAVNAVIDPGNPDDIVLDSSNSYEVSKTFDAQLSSGSGSLTYNWDWVEASEQATGLESTFTFDRDSSQTNTIKLTVSNGSQTDSTEVKQVLRDRPEVSASWDTNIDFGDDGDDDDDDNEVEREFTVSATNEFDGPLSYSWTVGGDPEGGNSNSLSHTFEEPEDEDEIDVVVNVTDSAGYFSSYEDTVDVDNNTETSSTQESSSGGGGGAATLESGFDETEYLFSVDEGDIKDAEFDESPVTSIKIKIADDVEDRVAIQSSTSGDRPDDADEDPSGTVYRYIELEKTNISDGDIESANFSFRVEKDWIDNNSIDPDSVRLMRYDEGWEELPTEETDDDDDYRYYRAESPGFSVFAITGDELSPDFEVQGIDLNVSDPSAGDTLEITVSVKNNGNAEGNYTVSFELAGEEFEEELEAVGPGETREASFVKKIESEGTWDIEVGDRSKTVDTTTGSSDISATSIENENPDQGGSLLFVLAAMVFVILAIIGGVLLYLEKGDEIEEYLNSASEEGSRTEPIMRKVNEILDMVSGEDEEEEEYSFEGFSN